MSDQTAHRKVLDLEAIRKRCEAVRQALVDAIVVVRYARFGQPIPAEVLSKPLEQVEDECDMAHLWMAQKHPALLAELTATRAENARLKEAIGGLYESIHGCGNHCCLIDPPKGMGTNDMCQCVRDMVKMQRVLHRVNRARAALEGKPNV